MKLFRMKIVIFNQNVTQLSPYLQQMHHIANASLFIYCISLGNMLNCVTLRDVTCGQVWLPILGICALHLTHPKCTHTAVNTHTPWTHTRSSGQPFMLRRLGAVGGSVPCSRAPQSWYWGWKSTCTFTPPTYNSCRTWDSNSQPLGYESDSLTIRPRLPRLRCKMGCKQPYVDCKFWYNNLTWPRVTLGS